MKQIRIGDKASRTLKITQEHVEAFGHLTNDLNPVHFDDEYAKNSMFKKRIAHGMYIGSLFSPIFGIDLPGEGSIYISQSLRFRRPVYFDDVITAEVTVKAKDKERQRVYFDCIAYNQKNEKVIVGEAELIPPTED